MLACILAALVCCGAAPGETALPDTPVYVGKSGKKYHRFDCRTLQNKKYSMSLAAAEKAGYEACLVCGGVLRAVPASQPPGGGAEGLAHGAPPALRGAGGVPYRVNVEELSSCRQADISRMLSGRVTRHVDGDTVHVTLENPLKGFNRVEKIRMIGVDTPETVHPNKAVEYFGREASDFTKSTLLDRNVYLALDWDTRDRYGRLLAYIYTPDGRCHNAELIRRGYAHAYTRFPFQFLEEFRALEREARMTKAGLWAGG
jgi:micrococcal nuclease